ncbi:pyruvate formate lyase family protein [Flavobacteriaceae bacterium MHTCC 0001]
MKNIQDINTTTSQEPQKGQLSFKQRMDKLRTKKLAVTQEKIDKEGGMDEGDYGRHVAPSDFKWEIIPNHYDGSFYGYSGWTTNFESLLANQPVYVDPYDALAGQTYFYLSKMKNSVYEKSEDPLKRRKPGSASCIWNPDFDYSHLKPWHEKYNIVHGIGNDAHYASDLKMGLELGWGGILKKLEYYRREHGRDKDLFYESEIRTVKAIQHWMKRTIALIDEKLEEETHPALIANLKEMKACNEYLLEGAPRTLKEVCQWLAWFVLAKRTYNRCGAGGQLDALLLPYYENDIREGVTTREEAVFNIACLLLIDAQYYQLAGPDENGIDQTSEMSHIILDAGEMLDCPLNLTIRVHDGLDQSLFERGVKLLFKYKQAWPRFSGDKSLVEGFMNAGYSRELANQRIAVGCNWMSLPGLEYTLNDVVKVNLAKVFEVAFEELANQNTEPSLEAFWKIYATHLQKAVEITADGNDFHMRHQQHNEPELVTNLLCHGPVEKGLDMTAGGAEYCNLAIDGAGIAVVADSLAAIEQRIIKEKRLSWQELFTQIKNNFEGKEGEDIRLMLNTSERYGQTNKNLAMKWAKKVTELWSELVRAQNERYPQYNFIPGLFSWANTLEFGEAVGPTPNGRKAQEPINHGANPLPGFRTDGAVTAMVNAISEVQCGYGNTSPVQLEMDPAVGESEDSIAKVTSLIKVMMDKGCTLLNINLIDEQRILEAHKNPSLYPDLVVRVTGFTSYFSMLSPRFRQLIVDRILSKQGV